MDKLNEIKKLMPNSIEDSLLISAIFDVSRKYDSLFVKEIKKIKKEKGITVDSIERSQLRKAFYYSLPNKYNLNFSYNDEQLSEVLDDFIARLNTYDSNTIISSLEKRIEDVGSNRINDNAIEWLNIYNKKRKKWDYSLLIVKINQKLFKKLDYSFDRITSFITNTYNNLENYRYISIVFDGSLVDKKGRNITWNIIYKTSVYAENFIQFKGKFFAFHKEKQIEKLSNFLHDRNINDYSELAEAFYDSASCGYKFEDCFISTDLNKKILLLKKIKLDETNVPCPSCMTTIQQGNSYPEMFLRSWECKNPKCPDRSKSGRGKRFDEYGIYRYFKLSESDNNNYINNQLYKDWHRDIFNKNLDYLEYLIMAYSWNTEKVCLVNYDDYQCDFGRKIIINNDLALFNLSGINYTDLPIYKLFNQVAQQLSIDKKGKTILKKQLTIYNENSSLYLKTLAPNQIGSAITSPPYYNAREYSQWENLIMYLIDMMINAKSINYALVDNSYYLYNIGDIVAEDNIYVNSHMSKHRIQLGFLSCMFFELVGFNLCGNIIWDKGEVQSKRNSTINLYSGYIKPVNCYEHMFVFNKGNDIKDNSKIIKLSPVIKINNKGENTYKHTAPYPVDLVNQIREFSIKDKYILDPFLGSGTTLIWCKNNNYKGVGFELNKEYFELCNENVFKNDTRND